MCIPAWPRSCADTAAASDAVRTSRPRRRYASGDEHPHRQQRNRTRSIRDHGPRVRARPHHAPGLVSEWNAVETERFRPLPAMDLRPAGMAVAQNRPVPSVETRVPDRGRHKAGSLRDAEKRRGRAGSVRKYVSTWIPATPMRAYPQQDGRLPPPADTRRSRDNNHPRRTRPKRAPCTPRPD